MKPPDMAAISQIMTTGSLDAETTAKAIAPEPVRGVPPRER